MGNGAQRIPSWPGALAPTKAEYICADQPVTLTFRLRQGGGPYMPVGGSYDRSTCQRFLSLIVFRLAFTSFFTRVTGIREPS